MVRGPAPSLGYGYRWWRCECLGCGVTVVRCTGYLAQRARDEKDLACPECLLELRAGRAHARRDLFLERLRYWWEESKTLYPPMFVDVLDDPESYYPVTARPQDPGPEDHTVACWDHAFSPREPVLWKTMRVGNGACWECEACAAETLVVHGCLLCQQLLCPECVEPHECSGRDYTLKEVGAEIEKIDGSLGMTREAARQLESSGIREIQRHFCHLEDLEASKSVVAETVADSRRRLAYEAGDRSQVRAIQRERSLAFQQYWQARAEARREGNVVLNAICDRAVARYRAAKAAAKKLAQHTVRPQPRAWFPVSPKKASTAVSSVVPGSPLALALSKASRPVLRTPLRGPRKRFYLDRIRGGVLSPEHAAAAAHVSRVLDYPMTRECFVTTKDTGLDQDPIARTWVPAWILVDRERLLVLVNECRATCAAPPVTILSVALAQAWAWSAGYTRSKTYLERLVYVSGFLCLGYELQEDNGRLSLEPSALPTEGCPA